MTDTRQTERTTRQLQGLVRAVRAISASLEHSEVLATIVREAALVMEVGACTLKLLDSTGEQLRWAADVGIPAEWRERPLSRRGEGLVGWVAAEGKPLAVPEPLTDPRILSEDFWTTFGFVSYLGVPVKEAGRTIGVLSFCTREPHRFTEDEIALALSFADQAAIALRNARLYEETERGAQELSTLYAVTASANQTLEVGTVCDEVFQKIEEMFRFDEGRIYLFTAARDALRLQASFHSGKSAWHPPEVLLPGQGNVGKVATTEQPIIYEDIQNDPRYRETTHSGAMTKSGLSFFAAFPIKAKLKTVGVMVCFGRSPRRLTPDEVRLLTTIGNQIGVAVENARLYEETERRRREAEALAEVARTLTESLDVKAVADQIVEGVCRLLDVRDATVYQLQDERSLLALAVSGGSDLRKTGYLLPVGTGVAGQAVVKGEPTSTTDILHDPNIVLADLHRRLAPLGDRSVLAVPLRSKGQIIGALSVSGQVGRVFIEAEISLLKTFGDQAAIALENARLFEETRRRAHEQSALSAIATAVSQSLNLDDILQIAADKLVELTGRERAAIRLKDPVTGEIRLIAHRGFLESSGESGTSGKVPVPVRPGVLRVFETGKTIVLGDPETIREWAPAGAIGDDAGAVALVPMNVGDRVVGVMTSATTRPIPYTPREVELLEAIGNVIGVAVENARLFDELKALTEELRGKNRELDAFVYTVTHDLKAPLVTLQGMAEVLVEGYGDRLDDQGRHYLSRLKANSRQMEQLIIDVLALSRIGREGRPAAAVPLGEVVEDLLLEWSETIRTRGINVACHDLPTLFGVRTQIEQVMSNLVGNAIKYLGEPSEPMIEIGTKDDGGPMVECYVRDNGIGIDPAYHEKVFEIFQRLEETDVEGTGVGLAIVKKIVEGAGGRIWVESAKGQGSTFRFTWPKAGGEADDRAGVKT